jgi:2-deoxy-D-gluconate 3-dehydrogenase
MALSLFSLEGKIALVTGGNGGLGRSIALGLRAAGAKVAVTGRNPEKNAAMSRELDQTGEVATLDVRDEEAVTRTIAQVVDRFGQLNILVNNAGLFRGGSVLNLTRDDWEAVIGTHLTGSFLCAKQAARVMITGKAGGKIINIGSMYSLFGPPDYPDYAAAKTGILGLTRALAVELAVHHIQVNAMLPGWFETDLTRGMPASPLGEQIRRKTPAGRWGNLEDVVGTAVFLASAASDFVTGACIPVDGGYAVADQSVHE